VAGSKIPIKRAWLVYNDPIGEPPAEVNDVPAARLLFDPKLFRPVLIAKAPDLQRGSFLANSGHSGGAHSRALWNTREQSTPDPNP
jgi:hypothetical protein